MQNNTAMDFTFTLVDVKEEISKALKEQLPKYNFEEVKVVKADPASPSEIPCIGINRISDDESDRTIADSTETFYNRDTKENVTVQGTFFAEALEIRIWHVNADERDRLYRTTKAVLFGIRPFLTEKGLLNLTLRSGRDEQDSSMANAPMVLYWSTITMTYLNPLDVKVIQVVEPISHVTPRTGFEGGNTDEQA